jgi:hypothetical protein
MDDQIVALYCLCDDLLKRHGRTQDPHTTRMSDAEVLTTALAAAQFFCGNLEHARRLFCAPPYIPGMLSRSRLNRRRHRLAPKLQTLLDRLGACEIHDAGSGSEAGDYVLDSFPVAACDNIRIRRSRLYRGEAYRAGSPANGASSTACASMCLPPRAGRSWRHFWPAPV